MTGSLLGCGGSELRPGADVLCSTAERAFGNRVERDSVGTLLATAACGDNPTILFLRARPKSGDID